MNFKRIADTSFKDMGNLNLWGLCSPFYIPRDYVKTVVSDETAFHLLRIGHQSPLAFIFRQIPQNLKIENREKLGETEWNPGLDGKGAQSHLNAAAILKTSTWLISTWRKVCLPVIYCSFNWFNNARIIN